MNTKILVTGGAGFIGSNTVNMLVRERYRVVIVDNLSTGKMENLNKDAKFYNKDITQPSLAEVFIEEKPKIVIHQAAQTNVKLSMKNPILDAKINILGTLNVLENCVKNKVKKIIYSSSGACYGEPDSLPVKETEIKPLNNYGVSKHCVEHYLFSYKKNYGIDYIILRYANVYGPRQPLEGASVISIFSNLILQNKSPNIFGDGEQTRDPFLEKRLVLFTCF